MALTGQAKTDYQREYMRRRRSNQGSNTNPVSVRPVTPNLVRPEGINDSQWAYIQYKAGGASQKVETPQGAGGQSDGYSPTDFSQFNNSG